MLLAAPALGREDTALDRYVAAPDPNYRYALINRISGDGYTGYVLELTSQQWRTAVEVDRPIWKHWLTIVKPDRVKTRTGALVISGGSNDSNPPTGVNPLLSGLAVATGSVVSEVRMVPNQPLMFADETRKRSEDAITAYTWDRYLRTGDDEWPVRLPMTKSAVRAMDAITAFCRSAEAGKAAVDKFVVGGASKRGWTSWTTAAVDKRVIGVVPVVIDMLNMQPSFEHHYRAYGSWASTLRDYAEMGIMRRAGTPQFQSLRAIEDPYAYRDRLTMPKFIVNSTGDQFFLPDSSQFYFDELTGEKYLRYVPNSDHSLNGSDADESVSAFYESIISGTSRPKFVWHFENDGSIRVKTETKPIEVKLWRATNPAARDFRFMTIGPAYRGSVLVDEGDGVYVGKVARPERGWVAYFVELTYASGSRYPFKFTTGVRVVPEDLPFGPPPQPESIEDRKSSHGR